MIKSADNFKILADLLKNPEYIENKTEIKSEGLFSKKKVIIEKQEIIMQIIAQIIMIKKNKTLKQRWNIDQQQINMQILNYYF